MTVPLNLIFFIFMFNFLFFLQWRFDLATPAAGLVYFVLVVFAIKTVARNIEWWDTRYLAEAGMKNNPLNAKMFMTMGNVLAQKVCNELKLVFPMCLHTLLCNHFSERIPFVNRYCLRCLNYALNWCQRSQCVSLKCSSFLITMNSG